MRCLILMIAAGMLFAPAVWSLEAHVSIPSEYLKVSPGEILRFEVFLKNINESGRNDFSFEYFVEKGGKVMLEKKEVKAIETQASFLGTISIPEDFEKGDYVLRVKINDSKGNSKSVYTNFFVERKRDLKWFVFLIGFVILAVALIILFEVRRLIRVDEEIEEIEFQRAGKHN